METIKTRRSIRKYQKRDVDNTLLSQLLEEAERTQTMGNLQLYSVVATRNSEIKEQLAPAHFNQPMVTFCADFRRTTLWAEQRQADPGYDNFLSFMNAATDALLFCQTFCNLAEEKGLGCCFLGTTVYMPDAIIDVLHLPQLVFPVATITLGWPDEQPPLSDRLPLSSILHTDVYHDYDTHAIDHAYAYKEQLEENQHFVAINHKKTLAQVFTDCRYTRRDNEVMSEGMLKALRRQGFLK